MAKIATDPTLFDNVLRINISTLKKWGFLVPGLNEECIINWGKRASCSFCINMNSEQPYIELEYKYNGTIRNCKIILIQVPSNLGIGVMWYFLCPRTSKRCRILYLVGGYFSHREAFTDCMYYCQTQSKKYRNCTGAFRELELDCKIDQLYHQTFTKYLKKKYNGVPTKNI